MPMNSRRLSLPRFSDFVFVDGSVENKQVDPVLECDDNGLGIVACEKARVDRQLTRNRAVVMTKPTRVERLRLAILLADFNRFFPLYMSDSVG
jgi:hypothetical protein